METLKNLYFRQQLSMLEKKKRPKTQFLIFRQMEFLALGLKSLLYFRTELDNYNKEFFLIL